MRTQLIVCLLLFTGADPWAQTLVDSIPLPDYGQSTNFYGLDGLGTILYLGKDSDGQIITFDTSTQSETGAFASPYDFCHGLAKTSNGFYILEEYSSSGAQMYEIDEEGNEIAVHDLPDGILGPPQGVGGLDLVGNAVWFTVYYQDSNDYPYAYAYLWDPSQVGFLDTVPMQGGQPHGIEQIGNLLVYVIDDNDGDIERLYGYDLENESLVFSADLPDTPTDNDISPRGLHFDGEFLWLIAKRSGGSAFAYQTLYKYDLGPLSISENVHQFHLALSPNPTRDRITISMAGQFIGSTFSIYNGSGRSVKNGRAEAQIIEISVSELSAGIYNLVILTKSGTASALFVKE